MRLPHGFVPLERFGHNVLAVRLNAPATAFGDMWRICSQCCRAASDGWIVSINPISVSSANKALNHIPNRCAGYNHTTFLRCILSLLQFGHLVSVQENIPCNCYVEVCAYSAPWPVESAWHGITNVITYQFDGTANPIGVNVPQPHIDIWLERVASLGFKPVNVGGMRNVLESADIMGTAHCHVGADSGLAQLAYSTGLPTDLVVYKGSRWALKAWHAMAPRRILRSLLNWSDGQHVDLQSGHRPDRWRECLHKNKLLRASSDSNLRFDLLDFYSC